jgi:protein-tyrosine kinase
MSRIHRILSKAERDGTAKRLAWPAEGEGMPAGNVRSMPNAWRTPQVTVAHAQVETFENQPAPHEGEDPTLLPARPVFGVKVHKLLVTAVEPFSQAAEQYRSLRARVVQAEGGYPRPVLAITSPGRGDGKTMTAGNLALAMAQEFDRRAIVIDADLRNARLHSLLGIAREPGLVEVLTGAARLEEALVSLPGHRLIVLPAGAGHTRPAELLGSAAMRRLIDVLRHQFDRLIVDGPPAHTADATAIAAAADGVLLVVRAASTPRPAIERALGVVPPAKLVGLVLTDSHPSDGLSPA